MRVLTVRDWRATLFGVILLGLGGAVWGETPDPFPSPHPRLFFTPEDLPALKEKTETGYSKTIWSNLIESAEWCLTKTPRSEWIAPEADDPDYENLYDRFYAMMGDMAVTEHLAFAAAVGEETRHIEAAKEWVLGCCRAWRPDADAAPDGGKAYAVSRLLKGIAVGYDLLYERFTEAEREEIREMLRQTADRYYREYFSSPTIAGPGFHTHHATVEFSSFGLVALALLGEATEAAEWLDFTVEKFVRDLLPRGLAPDGAQIEGATFWASTQHYRIFFMDALRRATGRDLFVEFPEAMNADLALASIAAGKTPGWSQSHESVVLSPSYGQLDYYSPVLLALAREYRRPIYQALAYWDRSLGHLQKTRYITPNREEQLLFELGGYAFLWFDPSVRPGYHGEKLSYEFPSVGEVYARGSWDMGGLLLALKRGGELVVHADGEAILVSLPEAGGGDISPATPTLQDEVQTAILGRDGAEEGEVVARLLRPDRAVLEWTEVKGQLKFWSRTAPKIQPGLLQWGDRAEIAILKGRLESLVDGGHQPSHAVGNGKLELIDPFPTAYPLITLTPDDSGILELEVRVEL